jgi:hypothetical protein
MKIEILLKHLASTAPYDQPAQLKINVTLSPYRSTTV